MAEFRGKRCSVHYMRRKLYLSLLNRFSGFVKERADCNRVSDFVKARADCILSLTSLNRELCSFDSLDRILEHFK